MDLATAQFSDSYSPIIDGVANVTRNYARWLNRILGPCSVVAPRFPGSREPDEGFPVLRYPSLAFPGNYPYRVGVPVADLNFMRHVASLPLDLVHVQSPLVSGVLGRWVARRRKIPLVVSFHTKYRDDFRRVLRADLFSDQCTRWVVQFLESADSVWVPSRSTVRTLEEYGYGGAVEVLENGTDLVPPPDTGGYRARANEELGSSDQVFVMLFVGQMIWEKNLRLLLDALHSLRDTTQEFLMVFVGSGYAADAMRERVTALGLDRVVRFVGPVKDRQRLQQYYARANLFLFPSLYDTSPLTVREAAAFHLPSVFVEGATASEGIVDGRNGFLAPGSSAGYAATLARLMGQPRLVREAGDGAKRTLYRTWEQVAAEVADRYVRIVGRSRGS